MNYTKEQIEEFKKKADKWDALENEIAKCYYKTDENGDFIEEDGSYVDHELDSEEEGDLIQIGELAALAFGFL